MERSDHWCWAPQILFLLQRLGKWVQPQAGLLWCSRQQLWPLDSLAQHRCWLLSTLPVPAAKARLARRDPGAQARLYRCESFDVTRDSCCTCSQSSERVSADALACTPSTAASGVQAAQPCSLRGCPQSRLRCRSWYTAGYGKMVMLTRASYSHGMPCSLAGAPEQSSRRRAGQLRTASPHALASPVWTEVQTPLQCLCIAATKAKHGCSRPRWCSSAPATDPSVVGRIAFAVRGPI